MLKEIIKEILVSELESNSTICKKEGNELESNSTICKKEGDESLASKYYGKYCMIRTYSAGVHYGKLTCKKGQEVELEDATRVWSWSGAFTLSQLSAEGSKDKSGCKFGMTIPKIVLDQVIEVIPMSDEAIENLGKIERCKK